MSGILWDRVDMEEDRPLDHVGDDRLVEVVKENFDHQSLNARAKGRLAAEELLYRAGHLDRDHFERDPAVRDDTMDAFGSGIEVGLAAGKMAHTVTVDGRFTSEGISVSAYDDDGNVLDEAWFTWDEVDEMKSDGESHFTFEL